MKMIAILILALALSGCGSGKIDDDAGANFAAANVVAPRVQTEAQVDASLGNIVAVDAPPPTARPVAGVPDLSPPSASRVRREALNFPTAFQGHWGLVPADCDISRPDSPGLMKIHGNKIDFHDSSAEVQATPEHTPYRIVADLAFEGAGRTWPLREGFELAVGGTQISRTVPAADGKRAQTLHYIRC